MSEHLTFEEAAELTVQLIAWVGELQRELIALRQWKASVPEASIRHLAQTDGARGGSLQWDRVQMWVKQLDDLEDEVQP